MTPTEIALQRIEFLLSNEHRNKLTLAVLAALKETARIR